MKSDADFKRDLQKSWEVVDRFAETYSALGYQVIVAPRQLRPDASQRMEFRDDGDMRLNNIRLEHKQKHAEWTCRDNFPYPDDFRIDEKYKIDDLDRDPMYAFVFSDRTEQYLAVVYGWTRPHWYIRPKPYYDKYQKRYVTTYCCPLKWVRFCRNGDLI